MAQVLHSHKPITSLPYYGGKSPRANNRICQWILEHLPPATKKQTYCEPFAGMLGVLLNRPRVHCEIVNDSSEHIINLWRYLRSHPTEMERLLRNTLRSEAEFNRALRELDSSDGLEQALNVAILIIMSIGNTPYGLSPRKLSASYRPRGNSNCDPFGSFADAIPMLHERIRRVQFLCRDALEILDRLKDVEEAVIYCDPPYRGANLGYYGDNTTDFGALKELLKVQKGRVALSSYGNYYDDLGWQRQEKTTKINVVKCRRPQRRTEVLWTNYDPLAGDMDTFFRLDAAA